MCIVRVVLAEGHHLVRQGVRSLLGNEPGFSVIEEAGDGITAAKLVEQLRPDVLLTGLTMPGINGLEVTRRVATRAVCTKVIVLSGYRNKSYVVEALRNGAQGYLLKESGISELSEAIPAVIEGRRYLSRGLQSNEILDRFERTDLDPFDTLTMREREVLQLAADGRSSREVARRLVISTRTAEAHRASIMRKLGLRTQTALVRYAFRKGILLMET